MTPKNADLDSLDLARLVRFAHLAAAAAHSPVRRDLMLDLDSVEHYPDQIPPAEPDCFALGDLPKEGVETRDSKRDLTRDLKD
ncbi:MAG: hypothetical protein L6R41_007999, partial [Letrouitia leprolyta]